MSNRFTPTPVTLAAGVTVLLWASAFVGIRDAGRHFGAGPLALGRLGVGALALGLLVLIRDERWPPRRAWPGILVCGLLWFGVYNVALNAAEHHLQAGIAAVLVNVGPIFIAILAGALLKEGFSRLLLAGGQGGDRVATLGRMSPLPDSAPLRAAVVGAGPSGFYATDQLLKAGFAVDLYDALPTPFGLVRAGVAPDHPKIKSVTRVYAKTAAHEAFRFFGGVELGGAVTREDLLERYHAVIYAFGTATDNRLGIPGEDRPGSHAATEFVAWYNGHPHFADQQFDLNGGRAVVIGNGNVAIDVARMLVLDPGELAPTDTADHAIDAFGMAGVTEVVLVGRRGPAQAAFTNPELRELGELKRADVIVEPAQLEGVEDPEDTTKRHNVEILRDYAQRVPEGKSHRLELRFLRSPVEILGQGESGPVTGVRLSVNRLVTGADGRVGVEPTGDEEVIECGLILRSIGYRGQPVGGIPFDPARGLIRNENGRVVDDQGVCCGEYAVGWIKRGPSGVIGTNKKDAADTVARILEDAEQGALRQPEPESAEAEAIEAWLTERVPDHVTWSGWEAIDAHESSLGEPAGRPRVKLVRLEELVRAARRSGSGPLD